ncbi:MAG: 1-deoxy-D-xylulose-5-phosphate synthase [Lentimonas sp.]|jgi:1-deoxy-D-xylulose-5-phosphate synthase
MLIDKISLPSDLRKLPSSNLKQVASELRLETINAVSKTGGHLGAGLGVIEITIALHYVFNTPDDKLIWDVGHQAYPHKILTGRKDRISTIRQPNGLSGFTKRSESEYDAFGTGHSSTSISAALGFAVARDLKEEERNVIAIIGDGAISAGMAYEAMNNAGATHNRLIVILNDNDMSIAPPVGAMSNYLSKLASSKSYLKFRGLSKKILDKLPHKISKYPRKLEKSIKEWWMGGNIFEEMGFYYIGPVDGHNLDVLVPILQNIRDDKSTKPILIHAVTQKGKGYNEVMKSDDRLHAVSKFDPETGIQDKKPTGNPTYSQVFGKTLANLAKKDSKIAAITAAMPGGTGLDIFAKEFAGQKPVRLFDVGIAEQHAVTFAAGLAADQIKPFVAIYSTFLQRAYDQIVHDTAIQKLPVRFMIDRAGFVGADGPTHAGSFDIAYLINLPNFVLMAPSNANELARMVLTASNINDRPSAIRYPRGEGGKFDIDLESLEPLEIGKGVIVNQGEEIAILCYGSIIENAKKAALILKETKNLNITIADARFAKPLDEELILNLAQNHKLLITLEEGVIGGFGSVVMQLLSVNNYLEKPNFKFRQLFMKDKFIEHNNIDVMQEEAGIGTQNIVNLITDLL